jgi:hypothetical protein
MGEFQTGQVDGFLGLASLDQEKVCGLMSETASGCLAAIDRRDFITFAELLAGGDHPVGEVEHGTLKETRAIRAGAGYAPFQADLLCFFQNCLTVIFRHKFIIPIIHSDSFGETT